MGAEALVPVCCRWSGRPAAGCCRLWAAALGGRAPRCAGRGRWRGLSWSLVRPSGSLLGPPPWWVALRAPIPMTTFFGIVITGGGRAVGRPPRWAALGVPRPDLLPYFCYYKIGRCACPLYLILRCAQKSTQRDTIHIYKTSTSICAIDILTKVWYNNISHSIKMIQGRISS